MSSWKTTVCFRLKDKTKGRTIYKKHKTETIEILSKKLLAPQNPVEIVFRWTNVSWLLPRREDLLKKPAHKIVQNMIHISSLKVLAMRQTNMLLNAAMILLLAHMICLNLCTYNAMRIRKSARLHRDVTFSKVALASQVSWSFRYWPPSRGERQAPLPLLAAFPGGAASAGKLSSSQCQNLFMVSFSSWVSFLRRALPDSIFWAMSACMVCRS